MSRSRETIRTLARAVGSTDHARLTAETIDEVIEGVSEIADAIDEEPSPAAVDDLLAFWDGYIRGGLDVEVPDDTAAASSSLEARIKRGNEADLFGLDLYQALLKLAENRSIDSERVSDRTASWAGRVATLTRDFVNHLEDHR